MTLQRILRKNVDKFVIFQRISQLSLKSIKLRLKDDRVQIQMRLGQIIEFQSRLDKSERQIIVFALFHVYYFTVN
jgi:hypothetical protein